MRPINSLRSDVAAKVAKALADLDARGIAYAVTDTLRTYAEQAALYAQGRQPLTVVNCLRATAGYRAITEGENNIVTNCDGTRKADGGHGRSPHQLGTAVDCVPVGAHGPEWPPADDPRWREIAKSFKAQGFTWGGDWEDFPDLPHYQVDA